MHTVATRRQSVCYVCVQESDTSRTVYRKTETNITQEGSRRSTHLKLVPSKTNTQNPLTSILQLRNDWVRAYGKRVNRGDVLRFTVPRPLLPAVSESLTPAMPRIFPPSVASQIWVDVSWSGSGRLKGAYDPQRTWVRIMMEAPVIRTE